MARRDRSFTQADLLRFYCRNIDNDERLAVLLAIVAGPCDDPGERDFCDWLEDIVWLIDKLCDLMALFPLTIRRNKKLVIFFEAVELLCMANARLKAVHGLVCE